MRESQRLSEQKSQGALAHSGKASSSHSAVRPQTIVTDLDARISERKSLANEYYSNNLQLDHSETSQILENPIFLDPNQVTHNRRQLSNFSVNMLSNQDQQVSPLGRQRQSLNVPHKIEGLISQQYNHQHAYVSRQH